MAEARRDCGVLMLFLDGVGLGAVDPACNPLAAARLPVLHDLIGGAPVAATPPRTTAGVVYRQLDAVLGYDGLPQSATGQTSLLTGRNGAELMGRHYGPWPGPTLVRALQRDTLFHRAGGRVVLANVYPDSYFRALQGRRMRPSAAVVAARAASVRLRDLTSYRAGEGLAADITGAAFVQLDPRLTPLEPEQAGRRLAGMARAQAFTFFDVWLTDRLGHQRRYAEGVALLERLDALLQGLLPELDGTTLVLTSDHGNLEDLATTRHTRNAVPLLAVGPGAEAFADVEDLMQAGQASARVLAGC